MTQQRLSVYYDIDKLQRKYKAYESPDNLPKRIRDFIREYYFLQTAIRPYEYLEDRKEFERAKANRHARKQRAYGYIKAVMSRMSPEFWTFTFKPEVMEKCSQQTLRVLTRRWLTENASCYFANGDFGALKGRYHVHALLQPKEESPAGFPYGFVKREQVHKSSVSARKLNTYLNKLVCHASKITSCRSFHSKGLKPVDADGFVTLLPDEELPF